MRWSKPHEPSGDVPPGNLDLTSVFVKPIKRLWESKSEKTKQQQKMNVEKISSKPQLKHAAGYSATCNTKDEGKHAGLAAGAMRTALAARWVRN